MKIEITDTAYGGYGVGRSEAGQVIFTPYTVTGDVVEVELVDDKKQFAYAKLINIIKRSDLRQTPICDKYESCGGCLFAHIKIEAQRDIKLNIIKNAFRKYSNDMPEIKSITSEVKGYRLRATVRARLGKVGFFGFKTNDFVEVETCNIIKPTLFEKIKEFAEVNNVTGEIYAIESEEGVAIANVKSEERITNKCSFDGVMNGEDVHGLKSMVYMTKFGGVGVGYDTFFQSNVHMLTVFQDRAIALVHPKLSVLELYSGSGFFTVGLMRVAKSVKAVESDKIAVKLAKAMGFPTMQAEVGNLLSIDKGADVIFLDPPRDGVSNKVIANLKRLKPMSIIYVSCNPQTLARDCIKLQDDYMIDDFTFFDMYPDTYHIECIVRLKKK